MDCYIGLGSNLGERQANLRAGLAGLAEEGLVPLAISSVWETEPVGTRDPGWFLNMAAHVESDRDPLGLLESLQAIERRAGRVRGVPNAPRTLDLDLLLVGDLVLDDPRLQLPHPSMWQRRFVLEPLAEIAPRARNPVSGRTVDEERRRLRDPARVRRLGCLASRSAVLL